MAGRRSRSRPRDVLAYVVIGVAFVGMIWLLAMRTTGWTEQAHSRLVNWIGLGGVLAIVFITAIHEHRHVWGTLRFWTVWTSALLAEATIGALALWNAPRLTVWVWALLYPVNAGVVEVFIGWWLQERGAIREERGGPTGR